MVLIGCLALLGPAPWFRRMRRLTESAELGVGSVGPLLGRACSSPAAGDYRLGYRPLISLVSRVMSVVAVTSGFPALARASDFQRTGVNSFCCREQGDATRAEAPP